MSFEPIAQKTNAGISNGRSYLDNKANTLLKPKTAKGISGFLFDIPDTEQVTLNSDITDHFTEDNSFINDHIVRKPIIITLTGFIGELVYRPPEGIGGLLAAIQNRLSTVDAYTGGKTPGAVQKSQEALNQAQNTVSAVNQTLDTVQNVVGFFDGDSASQTNQEEAFSKLYALWMSSELLTVQTPWMYKDNVVIQTITFNQDGETDQITDISVTLKEFRTAEIKTVEYDNNILPVRENIQADETQDQGIVRGRDENTSFLFSAFRGE